MNPQQPILVIGGTRGTGLLVARLLRQRGSQVRVLARNRERALALFDRSVAVVGGDVTKAETLHPAIDGVRHIIFTAGCRSGHPVREQTVKATEYDGVINTLTAARELGFAGRFMYMTSSGLMTPSVATFCLNVWKGNTLVWRRRVEAEIRRSGLEYTVIRTGVLLNQPGGQHEITVTQRALPLSLRYRIARADVAAVFVAALEDSRARCATFEAVWGPRGRPERLSGLFDQLQRDVDLSPEATASHANGADAGS